MKKFEIFNFAIFFQFFKFFDDLDFFDFLIFSKIATSRVQMKQQALLLFQVDPTYMTSTQSIKLNAPSYVFNVITTSNLIIG